MKTRNIPAIWSTYGREDLSQAQKMIDAGFEVEFDRNDIYNKRFELPHNNISFVMGNLVIWKVKDWITAELINGYYKNHTHYQSLDEILESLVGKMEYKFYDSIKLPFFCSGDMSGGCWLTNYNDEVEDRSNQMFIYVNATWNFFEEDEKPNGVEVIFRDENDEENEKLPKNQFFKFSEPTNLLELANYKQFYMGIIEKLSEKYLVD